MGCINSKKELNDINPNIYRVINVDSEGIALWSGQLGITRTELTLYRKGKEPTKWPLKCLRRYGYDADLFTFEAGRRCTTGEGIYAFRCRRAESLFQILQNYIQLPASMEDTLNQEMLPLPIMTNGPAVTPRSSLHLQNSDSGGGGGGGYYIVTNRPTSQNLSPSGTIQSNSNRTRSTDTINGEGNYLEPTPNRPINNVSRFNTGLRLSSVSSSGGGGGGVGGSGVGPLSPADPHSPGSPNSITNILEVTQLNPLPISNPGISNLYQEFPLRGTTESNNNNINNNANHTKKLSLDIPPQEPAPSLSKTTNAKSTPGCVAQTTTTSTTTTTQATNSQEDFLRNKQPQSPSSSNNPNDSVDHNYINVTPGEQQQQPLALTSKLISSISSSGGSETPTQIAQTPTGLTTPSIFGKMSQFSIDPNRSYENLEPGELRPLLLRNRFSKPDIFAKVDLPAASSDKSEPCTPTNRRYNYIVLDLDQTPSTTIGNSINSSLSSNSVSSALPPPPPITTATFVSTSNNTIIITNTNNNSINLSKSGGSTATTPLSSSGHSSGLLFLPPESPKKGVLDYATIDFNKTVALSNSTTPSSELDSEGSRKTRHSSVVAATTAVSTTTKHSNSISD